MTRPAPYLGQIARQCAHLLNSPEGHDLKGDDAITLIDEGRWRVPSVRTEWDSAMGGRTILEWEDATLIRSAIHDLGAESVAERTGIRPDLLLEKAA